MLSNRTKNINSVFWAYFLNSQEPKYKGNTPFSSGHCSFSPMTIKVLFVCIHNSARSQMAEELLRKVCDSGITVESAGIEPGVLNPLAIEVLLEDGIDIRGKQTKDVFDLYTAGRMYSHVITVCDEASAERCPIFAGVTQRLHWSFQDPSQFEGTWEEKIEHTRRVRDAIKRKVSEFCGEVCNVPT